MAGERFTEGKPVASSPAMPEGVWKSLTEIAAIHGISKVAVKKRVDRYEREGLLSTRRNGKERQVDMAAYERAIGVAGDAFREAAAETQRADREDTAPSSAMRSAQTEKAQWEARRSALEVNERLGNLLPVKGVEQAMVKAGEAIVRSLGQLATYAPDLIAAAKEGEPAVRRELRKIEHQLRAKVGAALTLIATEGKAAEATGGNEFDLSDGE